MKFFKPTLLLLLFPALVHTQDLPSPTLNIGDPAPDLGLYEWIKGTPIRSFEKGKVYVLEFWATWCVPCKAAMPHLSDLARQYKNTVTIIGVDVMENKTTSMEKVKAFVDSMGERMDYHVAAEDSNFMVAGWMEASGTQGIPSSFVVNGDGKLAWIGHPSRLDQVLPKIMNNSWKVDEASAKRKLDRRLRELDDSLNFELMRYSGDAYKQDYVGKPDSALSAINQIVTKEPGLKYAPFIASHTFSALLKTKPQEAYAYGKKVLATPTYDDPAYHIIIGLIEWYSDKLQLPAEIYRLGAEACQVGIDHISYPEIANLSKRYNQMAAWYWHAKDQLKAAEAQQKAIAQLKSRKDFSQGDLAAYESRLRQYTNR